MKRLFSTLTLLLVLAATAFAQVPVTKTSPDRASEPMTDKITEADIERYLDARMELDVQNTVLNALRLNKEQITDLQPIYLNYQTDLEKLDTRRKKLIMEYVEEMKEDDTAKDEENETADFVENFWEVDIDALKLKKDYFDRIEDITGTAKALDFFSLNEMYAARINRIRMQAVPDLKMMVTPMVTYQYELDDYRNWNRINIDGKVDVSHEFTANGLTKLWNTAQSIASAEGISVPDFMMKKEKVMMLAGKMQENWTSLKHADQAREAFTMTAEALNDLTAKAGITTSKQLMVTARMIDPAKKLTDQSQTIYSFFNQAEMMVNKVVEHANKMTR